MAMTMMLKYYGDEATFIDSIVVYVGIGIMSITCHNIMGVLGVYIHIFPDTSSDRAYLWYLFVGTTIMCTALHFTHTQI